MLKSFFTKLSMLVLFLAAVVCAYAAVTMVFTTSLWNIILGIVAVFFLFRFLEVADEVNKFGDYAEKDKPSDDADAGDNGDESNEP